jgi:hypothetical protein
MLVFAASSGCSSIEGHRVVPCPGDPCQVCIQDVKGLPIVVKTPKRAVFFVTESVYELSQKVPRTSAEGGGSKLVSLGVTETETTISKEPIMMGPYELYTIDPMRPAAGSLDYEIGLAEQYPTSIKGKVVDTTIVDTSKSIAELLEKFKGPSVEKQAGEDIIRTLKETRIKLLEVDLETGGITVRDVTGAPAAPCPPPVVPGEQQ